MKKLALFLSLLLLLAACGRAGQVPGSEPEPVPEPPESPASVSEPAPPEGVPAPASKPSQPEEPARQEEQKKLFERAGRLYEELKPVLGNAKDSVGYFYVSTNVSDMVVELVIGVVDEKTVDSLLAGWAGEPWDVLQKEECSCSIARQEEFAAAARKLELAPGVRVSASTAEMNAFDLRGVQISVELDDLWAPREEVERWAQMPRAVKELAEAMGVPEEMLGYTAPQFAAHEPGVSQPGSNPDENPNTFTSEKEEADFITQMERIIAIEKALPPVLETVKDSYEGYLVYDDIETTAVYLKILVIDEEKVDQALAAYQGERWDAVIKEKGRCSRAQMEAFVAELQKIEVAPGVYMEASVSNMQHDPITPIYAGVDSQSQLGQKVKDLAREMGIPEDMIWYPHREWLSGGTVTNPDT